MCRTGARRGGQQPPKRLRARPLDLKYEKQAAATNNGIFPTTPGYDMATGIGTPKMAALITGRE
jgi:hypothetical protein